MSIQTIDFSRINDGDTVLVKCRVIKTCYSRTRPAPFINSFKTESVIEIMSSSAASDYQTNNDDMMSVTVNDIERWIPAPFHAGDRVRFKKSTEACSDYTWIVLALDSENNKVWCKNTVDTTVTSSFDCNLLYKVP